MINPKNPNEISKLEKNEIAFPLIDYTAMLPLNLESSTLLSAYTLISKRVEPSFLEGLDWKNKGDISWQNNMLKQLSDNIYSMIEEYKNQPSEFLITKIFIWIQLWGGSTGRGVFIKGEKWPKNFKPKVYEKAVNQIEEKEYISALNTLNEMPHVATAFSTKHIHFWSNADAPIYDSIIGKIVFGRNTISHREYPKYIHALDNLVTELNTKSVSRSSIERNLFNWANTKEGQEWISLRTAS